MKNELKQKQIIKILDSLSFVCLLILFFFNAITLIISLLMKVYVAFILALCVEICLLITIKKDFSKNNRVVAICDNSQTEDITLIECPDFLLPVFSLNYSDRLFLFDLFLWEPFLQIPSRFFHNSVHAR